MGFRHSDIPSKELIRQALDAIHDRRGNKPTFIIEVNEKCDEKQLTQLLLQLKEWGSDRNLARFIVILSTSQAALLVPIGLHELRADCVSIDDPSEDVIKCYLEQCLDQLNEVSGKKKHQIITQCIEVLGTRFLDAYYLKVKYDKAACKTPEEVQQVCSEYSLPQGLSHIKDHLTNLPRCLIRKRY